MRISFPVISKKNMKYPKKPICPICRKNKVWEPHSFAMLWGGAMEKKGRDGYGSDIEDKKIVGFLSLEWHGAHDDGRGEFRECDCGIDIVDKAAGGNFGLYFCSTSCLREFLNKAVDKLEQEIQECMKEGRGGRKSRVK
jgi:hypothetical protein